MDKNERSLDDMWNGWDSQSSYLLFLSEKVQNLHRIALTKSAELNQLQQETKELEMKNSLLKVYLEIMEHKNRMQEELNKSVDLEIQKLKQSIRQTEGSKPSPSK